MSRDQLAVEAFGTGVLVAVLNILVCVRLSALARRLGLDMSSKEMVRLIAGPCVGMVMAGALALRTFGLVFS